MWVAEVPSLPGCITQGGTRAEAIENAKDAIDVWIAVMQEKGEAIPPEHFQVELCVV